MHDFDCFAINTVLQKIRNGLIFNQLHTGHYLDIVSKHFNEDIKRKKT